jgi:hypothetical protein
MVTSNAVENVIPSAGWRRGATREVMLAPAHTYEHYTDIGGRLWVRERAPDEAAVLRLLDEQHHPIFSDYNPWVKR